MIQVLNGIGNLTGNIEDYKLKHERIELQVDSSGQSINLSQYTETSTKKIVGVAIVGDDEDAMKASKLELSLGNQEIFPRNHEAKMLLCGLEVPPNERFFIFNRAIDVDRTEVKGAYIDGEEFSSSYNVTLVLLCFED